ncbi:MAG: DUF6067 family protein [Candidatus Omnitrophota bacterium]|nr:DUF6067 family protein [Candidatus Omnitrophota bacterium]
MPSTEKVLPEVGTLKGAHKNPAVLSLARNEYEAVQLILRSDTTALQQVTVEPSELKQIGGEGLIPREAITWSPVGFVQTKEPGYSVSHVGWWPDPLPKPAPFDVKLGWPQPIWLTVYAAPGTPAGEYAGLVTIRPANAQAQPVQVKVTVWDFDLPLMPSLKTAFDVYVNRIQSAYSQFFPEWWNRWSDKPEALARTFYDDLVRHRLAPILNADVSDAKVMTLLTQLRAQGLSAFGLGFHSGSFDNNWPTDRSQLESLAPVYRGYAATLRTAGLMERHYIYAYDEPKPGSRQVADVARMIHIADPALKNLVVLEDVESVDPLREWFGDIDIVCLRNVTFDPVQAQQLKQLGKEIWLYVSGPSAPYPTLVIDYPAMAYRVLPWMCWKYGLNGLLYWSVNYWTTNPYQDPMNTKWQQNGNGSLYYPGPDGPVPSIRLEVLRDGMEDYEYLHRLAEVVARAKVNGSKPPALIQQAETLLAVNPGLVESMRTYSKDPAVLERNRTAIAEMIEKLQKL